MSAEGERGFEEALTALEDIVLRLEKGQLSLDEAVARFEQGMKLSAECSAMLDQAELRVSILVNGPDGERTLAPFEGE